MLGGGKGHISISMIIVTEPGNGMGVVVVCPSHPKDLSSPISVDDGASE